MKFTLPYPISTNRVWRIGKGRNHKNPKVAAYREQAGWIAKSAGAKVLQGAVKVSMWLHPKLTKKGLASETRIDIDNAIKGVFDALNGICWVDDKQVVALSIVISAPVDGGGITVAVEKINGEKP